MTELAGIDHGQMESTGRAVALHKGKDGLLECWPSPLRLTNSLGPISARPGCMAAHFRDTSNHRPT
jgi:hypothetical protein